MTATYPAAVRGVTWPVMKSHEFSTDSSESRNFYSVRVANSQNPRWHWAFAYEYLKDDPQDLVAALAPHTDYRYLEGFLLSNLGEFAEFLFDDQIDDTIGMRSRGGGLQHSPSAFKVNSYPTYESYYPLGSYVVSNQATPHLYLVTQGGVAGTSVPSWTSTVTSGGVIMTDQGAFPGSDAQQLTLISSGGVYYAPLQRNFGGQFLEDVTDLDVSVYPLYVWDNGTLLTNGTDYNVLGPGLAVSGNAYQGLYLQFTGTPTGPITALCRFLFRVCLESDQTDIEQFLRQMWTLGGSASKNGSGVLKIMSSRVPSI